MLPIQSDLSLSYFVKQLLLENWVLNLKTIHHDFPAISQSLVALMSSWSLNEGLEWDRMWKSSSGRSLCWKKQLEGMEMVWKTKPYKLWCLNDLLLALRNHPQSQLQLCIFSPVFYCPISRVWFVAAVSRLYPEENGDLDWCSVSSILVLGLNSGRVTWLLTTWQYLILYILIYQA